MKSVVFFSCLIALGAAYPKGDDVLMKNGVFDPGKWKSMKFEC